MASANPVSVPSGYRVSIVRNTNIEQIETTLTPTVLLDMALSMIQLAAQPASSYTLALGPLIAACLPNYVWIWPWQGGSTCRHGQVLGKVFRQHSRIDLSLLQHQSTSEENHGRLLKRGSGYCRTFLCSVTQAPD